MLSTYELCGPTRTSTRVREGAMTGGGLSNPAHRSDPLLSNTHQNLKHTRPEQEKRVETNYLQDSGGGSSHFGADSAPHDDLGSSSGFKTKKTKTHTPCEN